MSDPDYLTALFAGSVALLMVVLWWPEGPESRVLERIAEGDTTPDIFIGIPDRVVKQFLTYDEENAGAEFQQFASAVRESARITLERRRASQ